MGYLGLNSLGSSPLGGGYIGTEESDVVVPIRNKEYLYKIYDSSGNFITTWTDVVSELQFSVSIGSGFSDLNITLARDVNVFGEGEDVKYGNQIKVIAFDKDNHYEGVQVYSGYLTAYTPKMEGYNQRIEVTFLSYWQEFARYMLESSSATEVTYSSYDPSDLLEDLLDKFTARGGKIDYDTGSVETTGTTVSYTFNTNTFRECIDKVVELSPVGWYTRVGADDIIYLKEKSTTADHTFTIGRDIAIIEQEKRIENITNIIYFKGDTIYKKYTRSGSVTSYGEYAKKIVDNRVSVAATADIMAGRVLDSAEDPEIRVRIRIVDNNSHTSEKGYDIESIFVGETVKIVGATSKGDNLWDELIWDTDSWDYDITNTAAQLLQIQKITYTAGYVDLELSNRQPDIAKRIEDINRNFVNSITENNATTPTT